MALSRWYDGSVYEVAIREGVSRSTVARRRRLDRAKSDPALRDKLQSQQQNVSARREQARQQRQHVHERAAAVQYGADNVCQPTPPTPSYPANAPASSLEVIRTLPDFFTALPYVLEYQRIGGSLDGYHCMDDTEEIVNQALPEQSRLTIWIYAFARTKTEAEIRADLKRIESHPTTIAWAIHAPHHTNAYFHCHVMSVESRAYRTAEDLRAEVNGSGTETLRYPPINFLRYMAKNRNGARAIGGVRFGPALPSSAQPALLVDLIAGGIDRESKSLKFVFDSATLLLSRARCGFPPGAHWSRFEQSVLGWMNSACAECSDEYLLDCRLRILAALSRVRSTLTAPLPSETYRQSRAEPTPIEQACNNDRFLKHAFHGAALQLLDLDRLARHILTGESLIVPTPIDAFTQALLDKAKQLKRTPSLVERFPCLENVSPMEQQLRRLLKNSKYVFRP